MNYLLFEYFFYIFAIYIKYRFAMEEYKFFNPNVLVSNYGRVSFLKYKTHTTYGTLTENGRYVVIISQKKYQVHRLVWNVFNGEIPDGYHIHHIDENPQNNHLDNLALMPSNEHLKMHKTGKHRSKETKQKMSISKKGCIPWNKGKQMSDEQKQKLTGKKRSLESRQKMSIAAKARYEKIC